MDLGQFKKRVETMTLGGGLGDCQVYPQSMLTRKRRLQFRQLDVGSHCFDQCMHLVGG